MLHHATVTHLAPTLTVSFCVLARAGEPSLYIPKILAPKLQLLDSEAFPYADRPDQMEALRDNLRLKEWLISSGIADSIISQQRITRKTKEAEWLQRRRRHEAIRRR
jgi:hypothetical protein